MLSILYKILDGLYNKVIKIKKKVNDSTKKKLFVFDKKIQIIGWTGSVGTDTNLFLFIIPNKTIIKKIYLGNHLRTPDNWTSSLERRCIKTYATTVSRIQMEISQCPYAVILLVANSVSILFVRIWALIGFGVNSCAPWSRTRVFVLGLFATTTIFTPGFFFFISTISCVILSSANCQSISMGSTLSWCSSNTFRASSAEDILKHLNPFRANTQLNNVLMSASSVAMTIV